MKKTTLAEDTQFDFYAFFEEEFSNSGPMTVYSDKSLKKLRGEEKDTALDGFLAALKWIFLYLPGVLAVHFLALGFGLAFFFDALWLDVLPGFAGIFAVATFMIMFGIGKLMDLRYLRVVLGVFLTSMCTAAIFSFLLSFTKGNFFGWYLLATLPPSVLIGHWVKNQIDRREREI